MWSLDENQARLKVTGDGEGIDPIIDSSNDLVSVNETLKYETDLFRLYGAEDLFPYAYFHVHINDKDCPEGLKEIMNDLQEGFPELFNLANRIKDSLIKMDLEWMVVSWRIMVKKSSPRNQNSPLN